jgi:prepilin-type N-terminal cleavage/methylation domain-containing protein
MRMFKSSFRDSYPGSQRALRTRGNSSAGFTLVEMLVVIGVMAVISALILANNNRFGGVVLLQNLAYDIALSVRQAQVYGIAVQRFNTSFDTGYGMHFQIDANPGTQSAYVLFADVNDNGLYDPTAELVQSTFIASGYRVSELCVRPASSAERCDITSLDVTFIRPEPDAYIRSSQVPGLHEAASVTVVSPRGDTKTIRMHANGQISVE